jgi:hypothetical protein
VRYIFAAFVVVIAVIIMLYAECRVTGYSISYCREHLSPAVDRLERLADPNK